MQPSGPIAILLATYNGAAHLDELMRSLLSQTYTDFVIMVRDDCSTDRTPEILARWSAAEPRRVVVVEDDRGNLRSRANFSRLMELCDTPYFAFCDQDDVWLPNKLEVSVRQIKQLEARLGDATPILVHSDLKLVDGELHEISDSFFRYSNVVPGHSERLDRMIINNVVQGCASAGNRALLELARPVPEGAPYHDWWVALVAASCGVLHTIGEPTMLWRQHGRNQVGAGHHRSGNTLWHARHVLRQPKLLGARMAVALRITQQQATVLLHNVGDVMPRRNRAFLRAFCLLQQRDNWACLPWGKRTWLFAQCLTIHMQRLLLFLRWCY